MTTVQIFIMLISIAVYGIGPIGIDLYKKSGMVSPYLLNGSLALEDGAAKGLFSKSLM